MKATTLDDTEIDVPFIEKVSCTTTEYGSRQTVYTISDKAQLMKFVEDNPKIELLLVEDKTNDLVGYFWPKRTIDLLNGAPN